MDSRPGSGGERETTEAGGGGAVCLSRLQARQDDVRRALDGRSLRVRIDYADPDAALSTVGVMFTRDGHVLPLRLDEPFEPHVEVRGTRQQVHAFLTGDTDLLDAVLTKLVVLRIPEDEVSHYRALRTLVTEELGAG